MSKINLNPRERRVLIFGAATLAVLVFYLYMTGSNSPWRKYQQSISQVAQARQRLEQVRLWEMEIEYMRSSEQQMDALLMERPRTFDLFSFVNRAIREANLTDRAPNLQNRALGGGFTGVELSLSGVSMEELVELLHKVYDADKLVMVERLDHLRPARDGRGLDCSILLRTPRGRA